MKLSLTKESASRLKMYGGVLFAGMVLIVVLLLKVLRMLSRLETLIMVYDGDDDFADFPEFSGAENSSFREELDLSDILSEMYEDDMED